MGARQTYTDPAKTGRRRPQAYIAGAGLVLLLAAPFGALLAMGTPPKDLAPDRSEFFKIATGSIAGTYFPVGEAIASVISNPPGAVRCETEGRCGPEGLIAVAQASQGSVRNVMLVEKGMASSALAQSDIVQLAYEGAGPFADKGAHRSLRAIANLYTESIHVVVARGLNIASVKQLKGKRVSVDREDSGTQATALAVLKAAGISPRQIDMRTTDVNQSAELMQAGELDAFFIMAGAPVPAIESLADAHGIRLLPLDEDIIAKLRKARPYLRETTIPAGAYEALGATRTVGVGALWIVNKDADAHVIYAITRALWNADNREILSSGHPQAAQIRFETATEDVPIPFHPGAERYYREAKAAQN